MNGLHLISVSFVCILKILCHLTLLMEHFLQISSIQPSNTFRCLPIFLIKYLYIYCFNTSDDLCDITEMITGIEIGPKLDLSSVNCNILYICFFFQPLPPCPSCPESVAIYQQHRQVGPQFTLS